MLTSGKYKQYLSIPEAALVWSGLPLSLLTDAAYPNPGIPFIPGHMDVAERALALVEATTHGTLTDCSRMDPDMPLPSPDRRLISRQALLAWIKKYWPDEAPVTQTKQTAPAASSPLHAAPEAQKDERLLKLKEVLETVGCSRATLDRWVKSGLFPKNTHSKPKRWPLSKVQAYVQKAQASEDI